MNKQSSLFQVLVVMQVPWEKIDQSMVQADIVFPKKCAGMGTFGMVYLH